MELTDLQQRFVLHWGEMGSRWGINRTMAQIHALLFLSPRPLNAEEIADTLQVARSNVSTSLRELQTWGIARIAHVLGDRRDHFMTPTDPWAVFRIILDERKRREIDPTVAVLRELAAEAERSGDEALRGRMTGLLEFFESALGWYAQLAALPDAALRRVFSAGGMIQRLLRGKP